MTTDIEKSFKAKLRIIAQENRRDPADLWQNLMLERFLARMEQSSHSKHFVLKGAILLSKYVDIGRETRDLDFLAHNISNDIDHLKIHFEEIASIDLQDGFEFKNVIVTELFHPHMGYPGASVTMTCFFGKTRSKVAIDIGFGDIVQPKMQTINLMHSAKGPLFESSLHLNCYPKEFIFAEKLETIVYRGATNSRMKDFHDLHSLIEHASTKPFEKLSNVIEAVFMHRQTPQELPLMHSAKDINLLQTFWGGYLRNLSINHAAKLPQDIASIIKIINDWLAIHLKS
jgi:predicted nucleotidyltransferase component of viral defense system